MKLHGVKLPVIQCDPGCGECCGPVICGDVEYDRVMVYAAENGIRPVRQGSRCPFYQNGQCAVYEVRPLPCKFFGHSPKLVCCRGYNRNVSAKEEEAITKRYGASEGRGDRFLHETCFSGADLLEVIEVAFSGI